jgi:hypothetical protein
MDHSIDGFVDGSIAAQHQDEVGARGYGVAGDMGGIVGAGSGRYARTDARAGQRIGGTLENPLRMPAEFAGRGIINQDRLLIRCNLLSIAPEA